MHPRGTPLQGRCPVPARLQVQRTCAALPQCQQAHAIGSLDFRQCTGNRGVSEDGRIDDGSLACDSRRLQGRLSRPKFRRRKCRRLCAGRGESKRRGERRRGNLRARQILHVRTPPRIRVLRLIARRRISRHQAVKHQCHQRAYAKPVAARPPLRSIERFHRRIFADRLRRVAAHDITQADFPVMQCDVHKSMRYVNSDQVSGARYWARPFSQSRPSNGMTVMDSMLPASMQRAFTLMPSG